MLAIFAGGGRLKSGTTIPPHVIGPGGTILALETEWQSCDAQDQERLDAEYVGDTWYRWNIEAGCLARVENTCEDCKALQRPDGGIWRRQVMRLTTRLSGQPFMDAGAIQREIEPAVGTLEHRPWVQETRDGLNVIGLRPEVAWQRMVRAGKVESRMAKAMLTLGIDPYVEEPLLRYATGKTRRYKHERVHFSPSLINARTGAPLTLEDFPPNWAFGNGHTANANVIRLRDGTFRVLSWVVTDYKQEERWRDPERLEVLRRIVEGTDTPVSSLEVR